MSGLDARLVTLFDGRAAFWVALVVALAAGAAHAVAPGHGKTVTSAYLVGTRGGPRDAVRLGVIVAIMHTLSVLALALAWVGLSGVASFATETVTAWLQVIAGAVVAVVGADLIRRQVRGRRTAVISPGEVAHAHDHGDGHVHDHGHGHVHAHERGGLGAGHDHAGGEVRLAERVRGGLLVHAHGGSRHSHEIPEDPWSRRGLLALGLSGGLLPSPTAFLVLVSGLLTGRAADAVVLVLAFGVGMAVTLTLVGVVTVRGSRLLARRDGRLSRTITAWSPVVAGVAVTVGGTIYVVAALSTLT